MSAKRAHAIAPAIVGPTSRRAFLRYGGGVVGASLLAPYWLRSAKAQSAATFDFYISATGNDSNAGTLASPWALSSLLISTQNNYNSTVAANRAKMAGKRVGVMAGTYNLMSVAGCVGTAVPGSWNQPMLQPPAGTSASTPTYVASCDASGNYSPLVAILDGQITMANTATQNPNGVPLFGAMGESGVQYITIDGFEIRNAAGHVMMVGGAAAISGYRAPGMTVQNCYLHDVHDNSAGANSAGITLYSCDGALFHNNYVTNVVNSNGRNTGVEMWNCVNCTIEYNTVILTSQSAGTFYAKNMNNSTLTVRYNYFDLSGAPGAQYCMGWDLTPQGAAISKCYNNVFLGGNMQTPSTGGAGGPNGTEAQYVYNNTLVPLSNYCAIQLFGAAGTMHAYNNIVSGGGGRGLVDFNASEPALTDYNLYTTVSLGLTGDGSNAYPTLYSNLAAWAAALPAGCIGKDAHAIAGAATFVGGTPALPGQKYQLAGGSPGKGSGSCNGQTSGTAIDMGAWGGTDVNTGGPITQIGCNFAPGSTTPPPVPMAPVLSVS